MTRSFKHLILTRFNTELYSAPARTSLDPDAWMEHRLRLFESFTLPSMAGQSCQDFTWLLAVDSETPDVYMQGLERLCLANMKLVPAKAGESVWLYDVELGPYDLLTTRIDNDDAFHHDAVAALHKAYHEQQAHLPRPWVMVFPLGVILDLPSLKSWIMEYWFNNCPTLVENRQHAATVRQWQHDQIPGTVPHHYIKDKPYWLQVVHRQNLRNAITSDNPLRKIHTDLPTRSEHLTLFGVNPNRLPNA